MAVRGCQVKILIDEHDLSGQSNSVTVDANVPALDYVTFQLCAQQRTPGLPACAIGHNGYFGGVGAGQLEQELHARLGAASNVIVGVILGTSLAIPVAYILPTAFAQQLKLNAPVAELLTVQGNWAGPSGNSLRRGLQVALGTAVAATGALAGVDYGAAGAAGGRAYLWLQAIVGGAVGATIKIQSDSVSNFASAADEGTFTVSAVGGYEINLSGVIGRYVRANVTGLGGATSLTFVIAVAVTGVSG